jgi:hypothetical protein
MVRYPWPATEVARLMTITRVSALILIPNVVLTLSYVIWWGDGIAKDVMRLR